MMVSMVSFLRAVLANSPCFPIRSVCDWSKLSSSTPRGGYRCWHIPVPRRRAKPSSSRSMPKAKGMVMGGGNFMAPALAKIFKAGEAGDDAAAVAIWREINPIVRVLGNGAYNSGIKAACEILGLKVGTVRAPIRPYAPEQN